MHYSTYILALTKFSKQIFNAFDQLLIYNRQNQCRNKHYLYPFPVTGAHFTQVDQGDYDFISCQRSSRET